MVRTHLVVLAASFSLLGLAPAAAGPLTSATRSVAIGIPGVPTLTLPGSGVSGSATSSTSATLAAGDAFRGYTFAYLSGAELSLAALAVASNGAGHFTGPTPNRVGGPMPVTGTAYITGLLRLALPFVIGAPDSRINTDFTKMGGVGLGLTARGASWTAGAAKLTDNGVTLSTITGANLLTPGGGGTLVLVSPNRIFTTLSASPFIPLPSFLTLTFAPVPEPGTLGLLGLGVLVLAVLGWRRAWA
jgi:hypothetical protein